MPVIHQFDFSENHVRAWQITESCETLLQEIRLRKDEKNIYRQFSNDRRKKQWLACRILVRQMLYPDDARLKQNPDGKPFLSPPIRHLSLSHSGEMAVAAINPEKATGIDIEKISDRILRVKERFMTREELDAIHDPADTALLSFYWCAKEAMFKLHGSPGIDFQKEIRIDPFDYLCPVNNPITGRILTPRKTIHCTLVYRRIGNYMMVVANEE